MVLSTTLVKLVSGTRVRTDMQWGVAGQDDDKNGIVDDIFERGQGDDKLNDDTTIPLFSSTFAGKSNEYRDANRNAYFRYQPMTRLDNLTTTHSNVYAVWITIGFFEVEEAPPLEDYPSGNPGFATRNGLNPALLKELALAKELYARVYPEGYQLGKELGSETGDFQRIREFAIIDRTIPVAFEPGKDHNVERAVRLRRRIE